ncbi:hypothetical protein CKM354_000760600 [Cercospora kikuchii]|uniref:Uncharacterized protein n=1 Tax=Cercospora kikuchii TaxID=84275 RepID=A0A9P3CKG2_9PEZI|nr:uncharacterized protein CKM354_000760600 [Cercospora kikuchii]GIZ44408.1 hypothetical protein CKM354_000760600 [Cercospora kikuchii]
MKSPVFAIAALATLTAAMEGSMFVAVHKRDVGFSPMNLGIFAKDGISCVDQNFCDTQTSCGVGEQSICDAKSKQCTCKITNGGAACDAAGGDGSSWYTDSKGNVCCGFPCDPKDGDPKCKDANTANQEKADCA